MRRATEQGAEPKNGGEIRGQMRKCCSTSGEPQNVVHLGCNRKCVPADHSCKDVSDGVLRLIKQVELTRHDMTCGLSNLSLLVNHQSLFVERIAS